MTSKPEDLNRQATEIAFVSLHSDNRGLTAANVPGRYIVMMTAVIFIIDESRFVAFVSSRRICPSYCKACATCPIRAVLAVIACV